MHQNDTHSDYCLIDHHSDSAKEIRKATMGPMWKEPAWLLRYVYLAVDRKMHFNGLRGRGWRALGVVRSTKNPNICNI